MTDITVEDVERWRYELKGNWALTPDQVDALCNAARCWIEYKMKRDSEFFGSVASSLEPTSEDEEIDTSDAPEVLDWSGAKRGLFYRPSDIAGVKERLADAIGRYESKRLIVNETRQTLRVIEGLELEIEGYRNVNWKHLYKQAHAEIDSLKSDNEWIIRVEAEQTEKLKDAQAEIERLQQQLGECQVGWESGTKAIEHNLALTAERDRLREALAKIADGSTAYSSSWQRDLARAALGEKYGYPHEDPPVEGYPNPVK